jgi:acyl-CoA synthetase (AMP-forming)/AMP-acid ligase II
VLLSEAHQRHDLSSLELITYGTEPMPESTLRRFHELFPHLQLTQTYGLSEVGILRSKSRSSDSLWVRVGGEGYETRVVDEMLQIRSASAMLGYLNAPSPFTDDGWFMTGDRVLVDGEWIRFLGRASERINVGGEKVFPAEVENVILELEDVAEVTVHGAKHAIMGEVVSAVVRPRPGAALEALPLAIKQHCVARLERFKVPVKIAIEDEPLHTERFKKRRG